MWVKGFSNDTLTTFIYAGLLFSGLIKSVLASFVVIDITLYFGVASIFIMVFSSLKVRVDLHLLVVLVLFLSFLIYYALLAVNSISPIYARSKLLGLFVTYLCMLYPLIVRVDFKLFIKLSFIITITACLISIYARAFLDYSFVSLYFRQLYLPAGTALGAIIVFYICQLDLVKDKVSDTRVLFFLSFCTLILFITGARGPIIFFVICMFFYLIYFVKVKGVISFFYLSLAVVLMGLLAIILDLDGTIFERSVSRIERLFSDDKGDSYNQRIEYFEVAFDMFLSSPFTGQGVGSFSFFYENTDARIYPHNILLELLSEIGLIGLFVFLSLTSLTLFYLMARPVYFVFILYIVFNMMKSGAFEDHRIFFGLTFLLVYYIKNEREKI